MIQKVARLKDYVDAERFKPNIFNLCEDERKEDVLILQFESISKQKEVDFNFIGISVGQFDVEKNNSKYFFKQTSANAVSDFPTIFITNSDIREDSTPSFMSKSIKKIKRILDSNIAVEPLLKNLLSAFQNKKILEDIDNISKSDSKRLFLLTFQIDELFIGESPFFSKIREQSAINVWRDYYSLGQKEIKKENRTCSVCFNKRQEIWGYVSTWNFYTAKTELAPLAGGLKQEDSWKNYPVCPDCATNLFSMKKLVTDKMRFKFCGFDYYLIPDFIRRDPKNSEIMEIFTDTNTAVGKFTFSKERQSITQDENDILDIIKETDNRVNYTMFFFKENNAEFKILLTIEDVFPSQFKRIFLAKERTESHQIYLRIKGLYEKDVVHDLKFQFDVVKNFFTIQSKKYGDFSKAFLEITRNIFLLKPIDYNFILRRIIEVIRQKFVNNEYLSNVVLKAMIFLNFLYELSIIKNTRNTISEVTMDSIYKDFFEEHKEFFCNNERKAIFLEGVLCQNLLDIQYQERTATPFRKRLNGLKLNERVVQRLLPEIIEKLNQYGKNYYRKLETLIADLLIKSSLGKLSNDEISFYFAMGMNLNKKFKEPDNQEEKND